MNTAKVKQHPNAQSDRQPKAMHVISPKQVQEVRGWLGWIAWICTLIYMLIDKIP